MLTNGDSDRFEPVEDDGKETNEETSHIGYSYVPPAADTQPEILGEEKVSEPAEETVVEEMVKIVNITRLDVQILILDEKGVEMQARLLRRSSYGPIARSRLTPQVESLQTNKHVRIESQN